MRTKRTVVAVATTVLSLLALGVVGAWTTGRHAGQVAREAGSSGVDRLDATTTAFALRAGTADGGGGATARPAAAVEVAGAHVVKTATVDVEVDDVRDAFSEASTIAAAAGGFVSSSSAGLASGSLTVRVPAERFDDVRRRLAGLGDLRSEEIRGDDVGAEVADVEARVRNLRAQEEALRALMARAAAVPETLQVQNELGSVRQQIEQLEAQRARLADAVTFATITVSIAEPGAAGARGPLATALERAIDGAELVAAGAIVAIGYIVPLALIALLLVAAQRALARLRAPGALASAQDGS